MLEPDPLNRTVSSLYETVLEPAKWDEALVNVARLFSVPAAAMFRYDCHTQTPSDFKSIGHDAEVQRLYITHYYQFDPGRTAGMQAAIGEWLADEQILDIHSPEQQEYVQDFALRSGIGGGAGFKVTGDADRFVYLGLQRRPDSERFGEAGRQVFLRIAPHLRRIIQMQSRIDTLTAGSALARAFIDRLQAGVLVVTRSRRVVLVNEHASTTLTATQAVFIANGKLMCNQPSAAENLRRVVDAACGAGRRGGAFSVARTAGRPVLLVNVLPIPQQHDLACLLTEPLALVVIGEPDAAHLSPDVYRALFSLTPAEASLMAALATGVSVRDWASQRGIALATVRTQLAALFEKTGVDSQARLVSLAKSLPATR